MTYSAIILSRDMINYNEIYLKNMYLKMSCVSHNVSLQSIFHGLNHINFIFNSNVYLI